MNIFCFRYNPGGLSQVALRQMNSEIMERMQECRVAAVSDTTLRGRYCLRAAINNHRTTRVGFDILIEDVGRLGTLLAKTGHGQR